MPEFQYLAKQRNGQQVRGQLAAVSRRDAVQALMTKSLAPLRVSEVNARRRFRGRVTGRTTAAFYSRLSDLLRAGVSLLRALEILSQQQKKPFLRETLTDVREKVAQGEGLAPALAAHPKVFSELVVSVIRAGEEGGFLEDALRRAAVFTEQQENLKSRVTGALAYPLFLLVVGAVVLIGMMTFFTPKFAPIFERLEQQGELPFATVALLGCSDFLRIYFIWIGLAVVGLAVGLHRFHKTTVGQRLADQWKMKAWVIGPLVRELALSRFCRVLGTLLRNGAPLLASLRIAKDAANSVVFREAVEQAAAHVTEGKTLAAPLEESGQFPPELIEIIAVGESANNLDTVLLDAADSMERQAQQKLDLAVKLIEPSLLLVMAIIILFFVAGLLLPVFQTADTLS